MHRLIILSERQSIRHHIIKLFDCQQWMIKIYKQTDLSKINHTPREALIVFHLDVFSFDRLQLIDQLSCDWQVFVIGDTLSTLQMEQIWNYQIIDYFAYDTPGIVVVKKMTRHLQMLDQTMATHCKALGNLRFDAIQGQISTKDMVIQLSKLENNLFNILLTHSGSYVSRATLVDAVWPVGVFASDDALDVLIRRTRYKLAPVGAKILVKRGFGYRLQVLE